LSSADNFRTRGGSSDADILTFWHKKLRIFQNFWYVSHGQEEVGLSQCVHFADKVEGVNFSQFCADVFYGQPLKHLSGFNVLFWLSRVYLFLCPSLGIGCFA